MHRFSIWVILVGTGAILGAQNRDPSRYPEYAQAQAVAREVLEGSRALLTKEVEAKGPAGAINACAAVALDLARKHEKEGWRVRRVSLRLRNPADKPDAYEAGVLRRFADLHASGKLPQEGEAAVVKEEGREFLRFVRPILVSSLLCLRCHGRPEEIAPEVRDQLGRLYPKDRATGYRFMDLRGAVSIRIPLGKP